jgi:hypothetical protein
MPLYRCDFLNARDHIQAYEEIDAGSLIDAIDRANMMLDHRGQHEAVEIWAGNRQVYRAERDRKLLAKSTHMAELRAARRARKGSIGQSMALSDSAAPEIAKCCASMLLA